MKMEIIPAAAGLSRAERKELNQLEAVIVDAIKLQLDAAQALLRIRNCRLYRAEYDTFEEYCRCRWNMSREHGRRLCNWAEVSANLDANATNGGKLPLHESHARPLARLTPQQQHIAWHEIKKLPQPDARLIEKVCDEVSRTPTNGNGKAIHVSVRPVEPPPAVARPISWHGSKAGLASRFIELIPADHTCYVEAFAGSLAVFFRKSRSKVEIINDLDANVVNLCRVLRDRKKADALQRLLTLTPYARDEHEFCRQHPEVEDEIEKARRFFVRCRQSYAGEADGPWAHSQVRNRADEFASPVDDMAAVTERLRHAQIEHADFRELLPPYDRPGVVAYLDPPYHDAAKRYAHTMDEADHEALLKMVWRFRKGRVILSGYRSPLYDSYLKKWRRYEIPKVMKAASTSTKATKIEVIWTNG
jgi:DNA adenine methylase